MMKRAAILTLMVVLAAAGSMQLSKAGPASEGSIDGNTERRLWARFEEESRRLDRSGFLYEDKDLETYVNAIAGRVRPGKSGPAITVKVIKNPYLNAFAYPTGRIYIHTGILASMENEAQLAALLGHEIVHVVNRHSALEATRKKERSESKIKLNSWLGSFGESLGQLGIMASVSGYSRELESEADKEGLEQAVKAGYDPHEAPKLFELFKQEISREKTKIPFVYSDHPKLQDRIDSYNALIESEYKGKQGKTDAETYLQHTFRMLLDNAVLDLKRGNIAGAEETVGKYMTRKPNDARAYFLLGEVLREKGETDGEKGAFAHYLKATALRPGYPDPYKAMGMIAYKKGDKQTAKKNLERYLVLQPDASDRDYIRQYIEECSK